MRKWVLWTLATTMLLLTVACSPSQTQHQTQEVTMETELTPRSDLIAVGEYAPDFMLQDAGGKLVRLSDWRGKKNVVLVFYPGDDTPGCTKQLCAIRDEIADFEDSETVVYGVNPQSAESHEKFIEKYNFPFTLLVDGGKVVAAAYGAKGMPMVKRTVYAIDKDGKVAFAERGMPANSTILAALK
ncbi:MAG: peroxiredoxin [Candidatus Sumerlaeota bacterium]